MFVPLNRFLSQSKQFVHAINALPKAKKASLSLQNISLQSEYKIETGERTDPGTMLFPEGALIRNGYDPKERP